MSGSSLIWRWRGRPMRTRSIGSRVNSADWRGGREAGSGDGDGGVDSGEEGGGGVGAEGGWGGRQRAWGGDEGKVRTQERGSGDMRRSEWDIMRINGRGDGWTSFLW